MDQRHPGCNDSCGMQASRFEIQGYEVDVVLKHDEIVPFVRSYFCKRNPVIYAFWSFNLMVATAMVFVLLSYECSSRHLGFFFMGFAFFILLIPLHELIHGIGYRLAGAQNVSYRAVWRKLVFYAMADRFFTARVPFVLLAIAPFLLINSLLILVISTSPESAFSWLAWGALLMHTAGCAGDFALISYMYEKWKLKPVVCDDVENGQTWFLVQKPLGYD